MLIVMLGQSFAHADTSNKLLDEVLVLLLFLLKALYSVLFNLFSLFRFFEPLSTCRMLYNLMPLNGKGFVHTH